MVNYSTTQLNNTFAALADPTRRAILARLAQGSATPTELAEPLAMSKPALSKHLRVLERAKLLQRVKQGRTHHLHLTAHPLYNAQQWLNDYQQFWQNQLHALQDYFDETAKDES